MEGGFPGGDEWLQEGAERDGLWRLPSKSHIKSLFHTLFSKATDCSFKYNFEGLYFT